MTEQNDDEKTPSDSQPECTRRSTTIWLCNWCIQIYNGIWSAFRDRLPEWADARCDDAKYSYHIKERRILYRCLDCILLPLGIRNVPRECEVDKCIKNCPVSYTHLTLPTKA